MICNNCGRVIDNKSTYCSNCGKKTYGILKVKNNKLDNKTTILIIVVTFILILIVNVRNFDKNNYSDNNVNISENNNVAVTEKTTVKTEKTRYKVGEVVDDGGLNIICESAEIWYDYNQYLTPKDGYKVLRIKIYAKNTVSSDRYINPYYFKCYVNNTIMENFYWMSDDMLQADSISKGRQTEGYLYFQVPKNSDYAEVEYELNIFTDKKAIFEFNY